MIQIIRTAILPKIKSDPQTLNVCNFKRLDTPNFTKDLVNLLLDIISQIDEDPNSIRLQWKTLFVDLLNKPAPFSTFRIKGNSAIYLTKEIKSMMYQRDYLKSKAYKTESRYLRQAYQHLRNKVCYSLRNLKLDYYTKKIQEASGNIKNTWKVLKNLLIIPPRWVTFRNSSLMVLK